MAIAGVNGMNSMWLNQIRQQMMAAQLPGAITQLTSAIQSLQSLLSSFQAGGVGGQAGAGGAGLGGNTMPGLGDLISKYTGMGLGGPQSLQNIEKLLGDLVAQLSGRPVAGGANGGQVTPPTYDQRPMGNELQQILQIVQQLLQQQQGGGVAPLSGAAGGGVPALGGGAGGGAVQNYIPLAPTGGTANGGAAGFGGLGNASSSVANTASIGSGNSFNSLLGQMMNASNANFANTQNMINNAGLDPNQAAMMNLQAQVEHQQEMATMISSLMKAFHETQMSIARNIAG